MDSGAAAQRNGRHTASVGDCERADAPYSLTPADRAFSTAFTELRTMLCSLTADAKRCMPVFECATGLVQKVAMFDCTSTGAQKWQHLRDAINTAKGYLDTLRLASTATDHLLVGDANSLYRALDGVCAALDRRERDLRNGQHRQGIG